MAEDREDRAICCNGECYQTIPKYELKSPNSDWVQTKNGWLCPSCDKEQSVKKPGRK